MARGERRSEHHCRMDIPLSCKSLRFECLPTEKKNHHKVCAHCAIPHALCGISAKMYVARERCIFGVVWKCFFLAHHVRVFFLLIASQFRLLLVRAAAVFSVADYLMLENRVVGKSAGKIG